jgi:hypothetical protein
MASTPSPTSAAMRNCGQSVCRASRISVRSSGSSSAIMAVGAFMGSTESSPPTAAGARQGTSQVLHQFVQLRVGVRVRSG